MGKAKVVARLTNEERKKLGLPVLGRPAITVPEGFEILSNGLFIHQWEWLKNYARLTGNRDGAQAQREAVQWFIDGVEASRAEVAATPEQDQEFEKLIQKKSVKKRKQVKPKSNK
jgi:hypothetical protein